MSGVPATLAQLLAQPALHLGCVVSGSQAYGTAVAGSDEDRRGLFALPARAYLSLTPPPAQLSDARGDVVWTSLRRTLELLAQGNPNQIELLYTPDDCILLDSPVFQRLRAARSRFLSQALVQAHMGYALGQVRKARGQNKWVNQPQPQTPPQREDYCWVIPRAAFAAGTTDPTALRPVPLVDSGIALEHHLASRLPHGRECWRLYAAAPGESAGVFSGGRIAHSSVPLDHETQRFAGLLFFHEQAFEHAQSEHRNYWTWRRERNPQRWLKQDSGALDYDAKNLMHTVRLLKSALHLLMHGEPLVRFAGTERAMLLAIRQGELDYHTIVAQVEALLARCNEALPRCTLPAAVALDDCESLLIEMTDLWESSL